MLCSNDGRTAPGEDATEAYQYAKIYAQWGNRVQAIRLRDPGRAELKTD